MTDATADTNASLRRTVYAMLIVVGTGAMLGRILAVNSVNLAKAEEDRVARIADDLQHRRDVLTKKGVSGEALQRELDRYEEQRRERANLQRPFLSANDRSRWCTVRALVEDDMRVENAPYAIDKVIQQRNWDTIDMVYHGEHYYSSKPTLLPTLMAAVYWPIYHATSWTLGTHPYEIGRFMLVLFNVAPLVIYFLLLARLVERFGTTDWGRMFVMASAVFGTLLTTFAVAINNHLPAAVCTVAAVYCAVPIWFGNRRTIGGPSVMLRGKKNLGARNLAALNLAEECGDDGIHQSADTGGSSPGGGSSGCEGLRRQRLGDFILVGLLAALAAANELPAASLVAVLAAALLWRSPWRTLVGFVPAAALVAAAALGTNWIAHHTLEPAYMHKGGDDNWYNYTYQRDGKTHESHWLHPDGLDGGFPSYGHYALHVLVGHHGIFSLTPVWLLSFAGMGVWMARRGGDCPDIRVSENGTVPLSARDATRLRWLSAAIAAMSLACIVFYLTRPAMDRNYSGASCGLRWLFWLAPLWLLTMLPAADFMAGRRWTRGLALVLLAVSVLSASYPTWNPWTHPWLMNFMQYMGWGT
jgi:hypothetical protein